SPLFRVIWCLWGTERTGPGPGRSADAYPTIFPISDASVNGRGAWDAPSALLHHQEQLVIADGEGRLVEIAVKGQRLQPVPADDPADLQDRVDPVGRPAGLRPPVSDEGVDGVQPALGRVVAVLDQHQHVPDGLPQSFRQVR